VIDASTHRKQPATTAGVVLSELRWWEIPEVQALEGLLFPGDPWSVPQFWSEVARIPESREYVVAREQPAGPIIGYAGLFQSSDEAQVQTIAVSPQAQGRGLGRVLLAELVRAARRRGARTLALEVRADNERALRLYAGAGFVADGRRRDYYGRGMDAVLMTLRVPQDDEAPDEGARARPGGGSSHG
jgi:[ribosomal protein S18]-alanine N-acetyltransferase